MNRIWISRQSSVPIREQISAQIVFAILSRGIEINERLPSVRDLARRIKVHANTVSAAYRDLAARGWVTNRAGSGVFVRDAKQRPREGGVEALAQSWLNEGVRKGYDLGALSDAFAKACQEFAERTQVRRLMVVHPDAEFARVLAAELQDAVKPEVLSATPDKAAAMTDLKAFVLLTTTSGEEAVAKFSNSHVMVPLKSLDQLLEGMSAPAAPVLVAMVSRSQTILKWASVLIPGLNRRGTELIQRNPDRPGWRRGLGACDMVVADFLAARELPAVSRAITFRLVADSFIEKARALVTDDKP